MQKTNLLPTLEAQIEGETYRFFLRESTLDEQDSIDQRWMDIANANPLKNKLRFNLLRDVIGEMSVSMPQKLNENGEFAPIADKEKTAVIEALNAHFKEFSDKRARGFLQIYLGFKEKMQEPVRFL